MTFQHRDMDFVANFKANEKQPPQKLRCKN